MPGSKEDLLIPLCLISEAGFPSRVGGLQKQELDDDRYPCSQERGDLQLVSVCVCVLGGGTCSHVPPPWHAGVMPSTTLTGQS